MNSFGINTCLKLISQTLLWREEEYIVVSTIIFNELRYLARSACHRARFKERTAFAQRVVFV